LGLRLVRILFDDMNVQFFEERRVTVSQANLQLIGVIEMLINGPGWNGEYVILSVVYRVAVNHCAARSANTEVHLGRIVPNGLCFLMWSEDAYRDANAVCKPVADAGGRI